MIQTAIQFRFFLVHRVHLGDGADIVEKSVRGDGECERRRQWGAAEAAAAALVVVVAVLCLAGGRGRGGGVARDGLLHGVCFGGGIAALVVAGGLWFFALCLRTVDAGVCMGQVLVVDAGVE